MSSQLTSSCEYYCKKAQLTRWENEPFDNEMLEEMLLAFHITFDIRCSISLSVYLPYHLQVCIQHGILLLYTVYWCTVSNGLAQLHKGAAFLKMLFGPRQLNTGLDLGTRGGSAVHLRLHCKVQGSLRHY